MSVGVTLPTSPPPSWWPNGFYTPAAGLGEIFHLDKYLAVELDDVRPFLEVVPAPRLGGFVAVVLGVLFIALGKGLAERRLRARNGALAALSLNILFQVYQQPSVRNWILSAAGLVLLGLFRTEFTRHSDRHRWSYAEVIAVLSIRLCPGLQNCRDVLAARRVQPR